MPQGRPALETILFRALQRRVVNTFRERYEGEYKAFANKLVEEAGELKADPRSTEEAADVLICLIGWVDARRITWRELIDAASKKMAVNEKREWERRDDGTWQHKEGT